MKCFSEKVYLEITPPTEEDTKSDQHRICQTLSDVGYKNAKIPLHILQKLYPLCRECDYHITVTLVYREKDWIVTDVEAGDTRQMHYGLAVDYGSTTIVMQLVDLNTGAVVAQVRGTNGQRTYGTDILTRITYTMEDSGHADDLQKVTVETFQSLIGQLASQTDIKVRSCPIMIVSGNTTMIHFLLKLNAWTVFSSPFAPVTTEPGWLWGSELGLDFSGMLYIIPSASNYVGGDIVSGLLNLDIRQSEDTLLFFDIGTNGELVIGNREWMLAGAGAAGPALEGYISRFGMQAGKGAIDTVTIHGKDLTFTTIDGSRPVGICGSGIIDVIAELFRTSAISAKGRFIRENPRIVYDKHGMGRYVLAASDQSETGREISITEVDIECFIRAKGAIFSAINIMLSSLDFSVSDISHIYVAGGIGSGINIENAVRIGMFPDVDRSVFEYIGNSSLAGAYAMALSDEAEQKVDELAANMTYLELSTNPRYMEEFMAACFLPHTNRELFPSSVQE